MGEYPLSPDSAEMPQLDDGMAAGKGTGAAEDIGVAGDTGFAVDVAEDVAVEGLYFLRLYVSH